MAETIMGLAQGPLLDARILWAENSNEGILV
jgi:hypothetical protein